MCPSVIRNSIKQPSAPTGETLVLARDEILSFCGRNDRKIRQLQDGLKAKIFTRGNEIVLSGAAGDVQQASQIIGDLLSVQRKGGKAISSRQIRQALRATQNEDGQTSLTDVFLDTIPLPNRAKHVAPLTHGQKKYVDAIRRSDIVLSIGPAGTGKTYLAVAMAAWHLAQGKVKRLILARPALEAGERLGFLPGDIAAKFNPFVRPLYDALYDMMDPERVRSYIDTGIIEIAPLAFMRGRSLNESFVILDEGQNTTTEQMKMFLTRLGDGSKAVVTGDITQIDLPQGKLSGLIHVQRILKNIEGVEFIFLKEDDVVRHGLVQRIVSAYERHSKKRR